MKPIPANPISIMAEWRARERQEWVLSQSWSRCECEHPPLNLIGKPCSDQVRKIAAALRELNSRRSVRDYVLDAAAAAI
jgi:hypothetical protein